MADDLVTVQTFPTLPAAEAARLHLEAAGIQVFLADAETVNMDWLLGNAIGYIKLQVHRSQAEAAREALAGIGPPPTPPAPEPSAVPERAVCLACGADLPTDRPECPACGWSYADKEGTLLQESLAAPESPEEPEPAEPAGGLATFRSIRRPVVLLFLWPLLVMAGMLALALLGLLVRFLFP
jgi:hypothetical protein